MKMKNLLFSSLRLCATALFGTLLLVQCDVNGEVGIGDKNSKKEMPLAKVSIYGERKDAAAVSSTTRSGDIINQSGVNIDLEDFFEAAKALTVLLPKESGYEVNIGELWKRTYVLGLVEKLVIEDLEGEGNTAQEAIDKCIENCRYLAKGLKDNPTALADIITSLEGYLGIPVIGDEPFYHETVGLKLYEALNDGNKDGLSTQGVVDASAAGAGDGQRGEGTGRWKVMYDVVETIVRLANEEEIAKKVITSIIGDTGVGVEIRDFLENNISAEEPLTVYFDVETNIPLESLEIMAPKIFTEGSGNEINIGTKDPITGIVTGATEVTNIDSLLDVLKNMTITTEVSLITFTIGEDSLEINPKEHYVIVTLKAVKNGAFHI